MRWELVEEKIGVTLLKFALPFLFSSFLQALYGAADLFIVGRFSGSEAVSAVAIGSQLMQTITGIILGISMGSTVLIARKIGEKDDASAGRAVGTTTLLFFLLALCLTPLMYVISEDLVLFMETPSAAISDTLVYLTICACGIPFIIGYNAVSGIFRGIGDSRSPMYFIALACLINIVLDYVFTGMWDMGTAGVAAATIIAQGASFVVSLFYMMKKGLGFPLSHRHFRLYRAELGRILIVGFPLALQDALVNVSFLVITAIVNTMGLIASAAVGVVEKIIVFAMLPPSSFASAVATMSATNIGAGKRKRAFHILWYGIGFSLVFGVCFCLFAQLMPTYATALFSADPAVIEASARYLMSYSIDCILVSFVFCMNSYFSSCNLSLIAFAHSMVATFAIRIPLTYLLSKTAGSDLYHMGLAAPAATLVSLFICLPVLYFMKSLRTD